MKRKNRLKPENPEIQEARGKLLAYVLEKKKKGDVITFTEITNATGIEPYGQWWKDVVNHLRRDLFRERSDVLWRGEHNGTYRLLTDSEKIRIPAIARMRRSGKQIRRAIKEVMAADKDNLSLHEMQSQTRTYDRLVVSRKAANVGLRVMHKEYKTETLPRRAQ